MRQTTLIFNLLLLHSIAIAAVYNAPPPPEFSKFDLNGDAYIDSTEFSKMHAIYFQTEDPNQDRQLKLREFQDFAFAVFDRNNDHTLSTDEWVDGRKSDFVKCMKGDDFKPFDENKDGVLSGGEFSAAFAKSDCFERFDTDHDGQINIQELTRHYFHVLDRNGDRKMDRKEFDTYKNTIDRLSKAAQKGQKKNN